MGGGSIDIAIFRLVGTKVYFKGNAASNHLGGDDFDKNILQSLIKRKPERYTEWKKLMKDCEKAKKDLELSDNVSIEVDETKYVLTKTLFEEINTPLLNQIDAMIMKALEKADTTTDEINEYILVGSSSLMPSVADIVSSRIGKEKQKYLVNADEAAVIGAAYFANELASFDKEMAIKRARERERTFESSLLVHEEFHMAKSIITRSITNGKSSDGNVHASEPKSPGSQLAPTGNDERGLKPGSSQKFEELIKKKNVVLELKSLKITAMDLVSSIELLKQKKCELDQHHQKVLEDIEKGCRGIIDRTDRNLLKTCNENFHVDKENMDKLEREFQKIYDDIHDQRNEFSSGGEHSRANSNFTERVCPLQAINTNNVDDTSLFVNSTC